MELNKKKPIQKKIWEYSISNNISTKKELSIKLNINLGSVKVYIQALYKANYIIYCCSTKRPKEIDLFKLIKFTGEKYPVFANGILKDFNTQTEYKLFKANRLETTATKEKIFKDVLDSFIAVNKQEILISEVSKVFMLNKDVQTKYGSTFLKRWVEKLEEKKYISFTGNRYRNSKI